MLQYFINLFKNITMRPSIKFINNLFFLIHMFSINFVHTLYIQFFINKKFLKIKWLKVFSPLSLSAYYYVYIIIIVMTLYIYII